MRRVSMATRDELVGVLRDRYGSADRVERGRILDEFVAVTGFHRKHAMRMLRAGAAIQPARARPRRRIYDDAVRQALVMTWEAADRICGKRLKALLPTLLEAMDRHGHLALDPTVRSRLLTMSAATIDRAFSEQRIAGGRKRRRLGPSSAVRRAVPVRTFSDWGDPAPGFAEADLVMHSGPSTRGSFVCTLVLTDIATGWTECAPLLMREQGLLTRVLDEVRTVLPFPLLGFDTDNDTVFMNETVQAYCAQAGLAFTRCRPYRKNDQAWVEQKNGAVVRRIVGYSRYAGFEAATVLARLYRVTRLYVNHFQPSFKLAGARAPGCASGTTRRPHPSRGSWPTRGRRRRWGARWMRCTSPSIRLRFCATCVPCKPSWPAWLIGPSSRRTSRRHRRWISSSPVCGRPGRTAKCVRPRAPSPSSSGNVEELIRSRA